MTAQRAYGSAVGRATGGLLLGALVAGVGACGLFLGAAGVPRAGDGAALVAGLVLLAVGAAYAWGAFAPGDGQRHQARASGSA